MTARCATCTQGVSGCGATGRWRCTVRSGAATSPATCSARRYTFCGPTTASGTAPSSTRCAGTRPCCGCIFALRVRSWVNELATVRVASWRAEVYGHFLYEHTPLLVLILIPCRAAECGGAQGQGRVPAHQRGGGHGAGRAPRQRRIRCQCARQPFCCRYVATSQARQRTCHDVARTEQCCAINSSMALRLLPRRSALYTPLCSPSAAS